MIDEGLWLVCYETGSAKYRSNASCFLEISNGMDQYSIHMAIQATNIGFTVIITNMVRLGDLEKDE